MIMAMQTMKSSKWRASLRMLLFPARARSDQMSVARPEENITKTQSLQSLLAELRGLARVLPGTMQSGSVTKATN